jgi:hypothetical protein
MIRLVAAAALPVVAAAPLLGAELVVRDLSLGLELQPTSFTYKLKDATGTRSGNDSFSSGYGAFLGTRWSFAGPGDSGGFLIGGEITYDQFTYVNGGAYTTYGGRLLGGYGFALSDRWSLEGLVDAGAGAGSFNVKGRAAFSSYTATGLYYSYAARLGVSFAVTERLLIDADAGYRFNTSNLTAGSTKVTLTGSGLCAALGLRYRFSNSPAPLE